MNVISLAFIRYGGTKRKRRKKQSKRKKKKDDDFKGTDDLEIPTRQ